MSDKEFTTDYTKANEFTAKACNIRKDYYCNSDNSTTGYWTTDIEPVELIVGQWTITDPRCREIIREKFRIVTDISTASFGNGYRFNAHQHLETKRYTGKTIAAAEIACILAIVEATDNG